MLSVAHPVLGASLIKPFEALATMYARRQTRISVEQDLHKLSRKELADIGIDSSDIESVATGMSFRR